jgi:hypothetical protein
MTTYAHTITFNDSEMIMLEEALKNMIALCDEKLKEGAGAPYWAHKHSAENVLNRMFDNTRQTSGNNF